MPQKLRRVISEKLNSVKNVLTKCPILNLIPMRFDEQVE